MKLWSDYRLVLTLIFNEFVPAWSKLLLAFTDFILNLPRAISRGCFPFSQKFRFNQLNCKSDTRGSGAESFRGTNGRPSLLVLHVFPFRPVGTEIAVSSKFPFRFCCLLAPSLRYQVNFFIDEWGCNFRTTGKKPFNLTRKFRNFQSKIWLNERRRSVRQARRLRPWILGFR